MSAMYRLVDFIAPPLTIRRQFLSLCEQVPSVLRTQGPIAVGQRAWAALLNYRMTGSLIIPVAPQPEPEPQPFSYMDWIAATEPTEDELSRQQIEQESLAYRPLVSIVVPVFNPSPRVLTAAIESVVAQTYPNWQLCLADGGSTDPEIVAVLDRYSDDQRISILRLEENLGISGNSNAALSVAHGEFVALLDHDDVLAPNMLFEVVTLLNRHAETDIVYFDEDKIPADGLLRDQPLFKPDFSPDLLLSANLLMHGVFRRSMVDEVGGFESAMDGAQDWDLVLRCTRRTSAIRHIPKILYHWRQVSGSVALANDAKPWAIDAQVAALERHIEATDGISPRVEVPHVGQTRIVWPRSAASVSIIIPTKDNLAVLKPCVDTILAKTDYTDYEFVLVDTGSVQEDTHSFYRELCARHTNVKVVDLPGPFNYSRANNAGAGEASGDLLLFLNNDTEVIEPDWLLEMAGWASRPGVGVVGAKLLHADGLIQHAGIIIGHSGPANHIFATMPEGSFGIFGSTEWYRTYHAVTGACMMVDRQVFARLGGFDEVYQLAYSDVDFCLRAERAGFRTVYTPFARLTHKEGRSRGYHLPSSDVLRCVCQTLPLIRRGDRNFNANLSLNNIVPALAEPGEPTSYQSLFRLLCAYGLLPPSQTDTAQSIEEVNLAQPVPWPETSLVSQAKSIEELTVLVVPGHLDTETSQSGLVSLAKECASLGAHTTLLTTTRSALLERVERYGVTIQVENAPSHLDEDDNWGSRVDVGTLTRAMAGTDLVIAYGIEASMAVSTAVAFNVPNILWLHEADAVFHAESLGARVREALDTTDLIMLAGKQTVDSYPEHLPPERVRVAPGAENEERSTYRKHLIDSIASVTQVAQQTVPEREL